MPWVAVNLCPGELIRVTDFEKRLWAPPSLDLCVPPPNDFGKKLDIKLEHEFDSGITTANKGTEI